MRRPASNDELKIMTAEVLAGRCINFPSLVPTSVVPHTFSTTITLPNIIGENGLLIMRPSIFRSLTYYDPQRSQQFFNPYNISSDTIQNRWVLSVPAADRVSLVSEYLSGEVDEADKFSIRHLDFPQPQRWKLDAITGKVIPGNRVYMMTCLNTVNENFYLNFHNSNPTTLVAGLEIEYYDETLATVYTTTGATVSIPGNGNGLLEVTFPDSGSIPNHHYVGFYLFVTSGSTTIVTSNNSFGAFSGAGFNVNATIGRDYSALLSVAQSADILLQQYNLAETFRVTSCMMVMKNATASIAKGGTVYAAVFPGNSYGNVPRVENLNAFISSRDNAWTSDLDNGLTYYYKPEKIQDYIFKTTNLTFRDLIYGVVDLPYAIVQINPPPQAPGNPFPLAITVEMHITVQYKTSDVSAPHIQLAGDPTYFLQSFISVLSAEADFSENPSHWEKIKSIAMKVARNPVVTSAFKNLSKQAVTSIMEALA